MKVINFLNRKGGVGKTSTCANLANELARKGYITLLLDLDSQCDITDFFLTQAGLLNGDAKPPNIRHVLQNECSIAHARIKIKNNLYLVPGSPELDGFDFKYSQQALRDKLQARKLKKVDFVLIDNPPNINEAVKCGLVATNYVVVVTEVENPAMNNLKKVKHQLDSIQKALNPNLVTLGIALNKIDLRRKITIRNIDRIQLEYGALVFDSQISIDSAIPNSLDGAVPVRELKWRSRTVSQYQRLLGEILFRIHELEGSNESA